MFDKGRCSSVLITDLKQVFIHFVVICECDFSYCFAAFGQVVASNKQLGFDYWNQRRI